MPRSSAKVAIVTGSSSGIGLALTQALHSEGWNVAGFDLQSPPPSLTNATDNFIHIPCDVSNYDAQAHAFQTTFNRWGRIDALCANAGIIDRSSIYILSHRGKTDIPPRPDTSCTDVDYKGVIYGTQLAVHFMRQNQPPGGNIVATASAVGVHPLASFPEYCGAKAAVIHFARSTAPILKLKDDITINVVCPGVAATAQIPEQMRETFGSEGMTPLETLTSGYLRFLNDRSLNGQIMDCSNTRQYLLDPPPFADGEVEKRTCTIYDPYFKFIHGEGSGMEDVLARVD